MRCPETKLSVSYAYKMGCRCAACVANKAKYTRAEGPKARERVRAWLAAHPGRARQYGRKSDHKRRLARYQALRKKYGTVCAICKRDTSKDTIGHGPRLHMDHDHKTGKVRGLLCGGCNVGLGHFKEKPAILRAAARYLEKHNDQ